MSPGSSPSYEGIERTVQLMLLLSGLCSGLHYRYYFVNQNKGWIGAQTHCRQKYTDLATVYDMEDMQGAIDAVGCGFVGHVWIGLHDRDWKWMWSLSDDGFYGAGEDQFRKWGKNNPDNNKGRATCVVTANGLWYDGYCSSTYDFVCYDRTKDLADRLVHVQQRKSWTDAQSYCRQHHTDLASVRNQSENLEIKNMAQVPKWIGLFRNPWETWSDGSNSTFTHWASGKPDNDSPKQKCFSVAIDAVQSGKWDDRQCLGKRPFICYNPILKKRFVRIKLSSVDPSLDPKDPAVAEGLLEQLRKRMRDMGMNNRVKIEWKRRPDGEIFYKEGKDKKEDLMKEEL